MSNNNDHYKSWETSVDCLIKKMVSMFYENLDLDAVPEQAMRPGGLKLTKEVLNVVGMQPGFKVLDVACGVGTTLLTLIEEFKCHVCGLDISAKLLNRARTRLSSKGYDANSLLICADSEFIPVREGCFDVVVCECSLSLFPNKLKALKEMAYVVRKGGSVVLTDVTIKDYSVRCVKDANWCMCVAGAETLEGYIELVENAGLNVLYSKDVSEVYDWSMVSKEVRETLEGRIGYAVIVGVKS